MKKALFAVFAAIIFCFSIHSGNDQGVSGFVFDQPSNVTWLSQMASRAASSAYQGASDALQLLQGYAKVAGTQAWQSVSSSSSKFLESAEGQFSSISKYALEQTAQLSGSLQAQMIELLQSRGANQFLIDRLAAMDPLLFAVTVSALVGSTAYAVYKVTPRVKLGDSAINWYEPRVDISASAFNRDTTAVLGDSMMTRLGRRLKSLVTVGNGTSAAARAGFQYRNTGYVVASHLSKAENPALTYITVKAGNMEELKNAIKDKVQALSIRMSDALSYPDFLTQTIRSEKSVEQLQEYVRFYTYVLQHEVSVYIENSSWAMKLRKNSALRALNTFIDSYIAYADTVISQMAQSESNRNTSVRQQLFASLIDKQTKLKAWLPELFPN